jgi:hypothetical protein
MRKFSSVAMAQNLPTYTADQARDILSTPEKIVQTYQQAQKSDDQQMHFVKPVHIARQLLDAVKDDQQFLRQVYATYAPREMSYNGPTNESAESVISSGYIAPNALRHMNAGDDAYFKQVFEKATGNHSYHVQTEALRKINDLTYVKKAITEDAKVDEGAANPGADFLLVRGAELYKADPQFVDALAENAVDTFVRQHAIGATSNRTILRKYASLTDIDQQRHPAGSEAQHRAFTNSNYQRAAAQRLAQLDKNK